MCAELNKKLIFCSASCAIQYAILEARLQGVAWCTRCKEWAGREDSLCTCKQDETTLEWLKKAATAGNGGVS